MAENFTFELVSPEKLLLSGDAEMVTVPGSEGDMGILAKHAAVMTSLRPGLVGVKMGDGTENSFFVRGGFADITPTSVTVLAEFAVAKADITRELWDEQKRLAQEALDGEEDPEKKAAAQSYVQQLDVLESAVLSA